MNIKDPTRTLEILIPFLHKVLRSEKAEFYRRYSITPAQFDVLSALSNGSMSLSQLSEAVLLDSSTLVGIVDRLEKNGLVKKKISYKDRRKNIISLSEKGKEFLSLIPAFSSATLRAVIEDLSPLKRENFVQVLQEISKKLELEYVENIKGMNDSNNCEKSLPVF